MSRAGAGQIRVLTSLLSSVVLIALAVGLAWSGVASAAGPARAGSTFATSFLALPAGSTSGGQSGFGGDSVERSALSASGRYVAFVSAANSLSRAANPDVSNIFRKDRQTGAVELVSRMTGNNGAAPAQSSRDPRISADGNLVTFLTEAPLAPEDIDGKGDVYLRNLTTKVTTLATPNTTTGPVFQHDLSGDGQFIAFASPEVLAGTDLNNKPDVFRRNLGSGAVNLVSRIPASETAANNYSDFPSISGDGRWVAFRSAADNLAVVFGDANGSAPDVFARDMVGDSTLLVSSTFNNGIFGGNGESSEPVIAGTPAGSAELKVAYSSYSTNVAAGGVDASNASSVYLRASFAAAPSILVSQSTGGANADSRAHTPAISDNGDRILFSSDAGNLGAGADYYGAYLRDVGANTTVLGSARNEYAIAADIAGNGNLIAWGEAGGATADSDPDAYGVFTRAIPGGPVRFVSRPKGGRPFLLPGATVNTSSEGARTISANGRYVVLGLISNRLGTGLGPEIFRRDLTSGRLELVSRKSGKSGQKSGGSFGASISSDGSRVAFISYEPLVPADTDDKMDVYVRFLNTRRTVLASRANGQGGVDGDSFATEASISGNGKRVAFSTDSSNLGVPGNKVQIFVRDLSTNKTIFVSRATGPAGVPGNENSMGPVISNNGSVVAFRSISTNLDPDDANADYDIYVRNLATSSLLLASREPGPAGAASPASEYYAALSGDGKVIAFNTSHEPLVPGTGPWPPATSQIVSRVLATGANTLVSRTTGGAVANLDSWRPSLNRDGSLIAFETSAENLLAGRGGASQKAMVVRNMKTGRYSGPPVFGLKVNDPAQGSGNPSISDNGRCVSFTGYGHNTASGDLSDFSSGYVYVVSGTCPNPRGIPKPKLSRVLVGRSTISFRLNTKATVTISFQRKRGGGFAPAGKIVRKNQKAGKRSFRYRGKVGKRKLKPGTYRVTLVAKGPSGSSRKVRKNLRIRRR